PDVLERTLQFGLERLGAGLRERVPQVVHRTALVLRFGKVAPEGLEEAHMLVGDHVADPFEAPLDQIREDAAPALQALARAEPHAQVLAVARFADAYDPEHGGGSHPALSPHLLNVRIHDQVGVARARKATTPPRLQFRVQLLGERTHLRGRDRKATEHLDHLRYLSRAHALEVHLHQGEHERFLAALVSLEEARLEAALAVLRHPQLEGAQPGLERAPLPTISPPPPRRRALPGASAQETLELPLEGLLHHRLEHPAQDLIGRAPHPRTLMGSGSKGSLGGEGHRLSPGSWRAATRRVNGVSAQKRYGGLSSSSNLPAPPPTETTENYAHSLGEGLQLGAGTNEHGLIFAFSPLILGEGIATAPALPSGAHPHDPFSPLILGEGIATGG